MRTQLKYIIALVVLLVIAATGLYLINSGKELKPQNNQLDNNTFSAIDSEIEQASKKQVTLDNVGVKVSVPDYWIEYQPYTSANRFFFNTNVNLHADAKRGTNHSIATIPNPSGIQASQIAEDLQRRNWTGEVTVSSVNNLPLISFSYQAKSGLERAGIILKDKMIYAITGDLLSPSILQSIEFTPPAIAEGTVPLLLGKYSEASLEELNTGWVYDDGASVTIQFTFANLYHPEQPFTTSFSTTDPQDTVLKQPRPDVFEYLRAKGVYAIFGNQGFQGSHAIPIGKYKLDTVSYNGITFPDNIHQKKIVISTGDSTIDEASSLLDGNLSPNSRYYYHITSPGPLIFTDLQTGIQKPFKGADERQFVETKGIVWSPDSKHIAFMYRIPHSEYVFPVLNILSIDEIMSGKYQNDKRILSASEHQSYAWQNNNSLVIVTQNGESRETGLYDNTYIAIYHLDRARDEFEYILKESLKNQGGATIAPTANKILFTPTTSAGPYTITTLNGTLIKTLPQFREDWYR